MKQREKYGQSEREMLKEGIKSITYELKLLRKNRDLFLKNYEEDLVRRIKLLRGELRKVNRK